MNAIRSYSVECENGHNVELSPDDLVDALSEGYCPKIGCNCEIISVDPDEITVECPFCFWADTQPWKDAIAYFGEGCPHCERQGDSFTPLYIEDSARALAKTYEYLSSTTPASTLLRKGRTDYWEILIHFCQYAELSSILDQEKVLAQPTGYYREPAVCLTDIPLPNATEIRQKHGEYGIAFKKKSLLPLGAAPAFYLSNSQIKSQEAVGGFASELRPFVNLLRVVPKTTPPSKGFVDFLHEREWRIPKDIDLKAYQPIGIILPPGHATFKIKGPFAQQLLSAAIRYGEIE